MKMALSSYTKEGPVVKALLYFAAQALPLVPKDNALPLKPSPYSHDAFGQLFFGKAQTIPRDNQK
jgi:hypothetical protein